MSQIETLLFIGLIGMLSDRVGRRILAVLGFLICGVFFILFGHAQDISLALGITGMGGQIFVTFLIRFIIGIGIILSFQQTITIVGDYTASTDRGKGMAWHGAMMALGSMIVFGVLARIAGKTGLMSLFYMSGVLGFLGLIVSRLGLVDRMPEEKARKLGIRETYREVSKSIAIKAGYMVTLVMRADIIVKSVFLFVWLLTVRSRIKEIEEAAPVHSLTFTMAWADEAKMMLEKVPGPFREAAVSGTETYAMEYSCEKVTAEVMTNHRKELAYSFLQGVLYPLSVQKYPAARST